MDVFSDFTCNHEDVYSNNVDTLYTVARTLKMLVKVREDLLNPDNSK